MKTPFMTLRPLLALLLASLVTACSPGASTDAPVQADAPIAAESLATAVDLETVLASSFRARGQAKLDRLQRNEMQVICSDAPKDQPDSADAKAITTAALAAVVFPADGAFLGDWQAGEQVAQTGTGMQYSDDSAKPNGGNCYACHKLAPDEIAYGTLGPSLEAYGKLRGNSQPMLEYTWTRIWNSHAYNACSHMPRFGEAGILTEQQIKDVMALLFDPESPVNQ
jgi:L-cysteine S-thiosulfotransferase